MPRAWDLSHLADRSAEISSSWHLPRRWFWATAATLLTAVAPVLSADDAELGAQQRLRQAVTVLASDELEGRGPGTKGIDQAAEFIAKEFELLGLKTDLYDGKPYQVFKISLGAKLGPVNEVALQGPPPKENEAAPAPVKLELGGDFQTLALGGSAKFDLPIVFAGYGITAPKEEYDDYAGIDVKGKAVLILRRVPQQGNPHSKFGGDAITNMHAPLTRKISNAFQHGAAAVLLVNDAHDLDKSRKELETAVLKAVNQVVEHDYKFVHPETPPKETPAEIAAMREKLVDSVFKLGMRLHDSQDPLLPFNYGGTSSEGRNDLPVLHISRATADKLLQGSLGKSLAQLEKQIDKGPEPASAVLPGWKIGGEVSVKRTEIEVKNVLGVLEGTGPHADETIVIGAHYDHLGFGGSGSRAPGEKAIHNGADDNASGTAGLLEIARELSRRDQKLGRRILFIAFTGEEEGLLGSARYVRDPLIPIDKTVAMLNMDMIGRLRDNKLLVYGTGTAKEFGPLLDKLNEKETFKLTRKPEGFGPSDHSSFYARQIPVLHYFTDLHPEYHTPKDDVETLDFSGMQRVAKLVVDTAVALANAPEKPTFVQVEAPKVAGDKPQSSRPYFGSIPDFGQDQPGYALMGVSKGGPAEKGGLKGGDLIIKLGDSKIGNLEDFDSALRNFKANEVVPVTVKREGKELVLPITLEPAR